MRLKSLFAIVVPLLLLGCPAAQAAEKRESLFDVAADFDGDGKADRAVLILQGPGRDMSWDLATGIYPLADAETVDLAIYLGAGDAPVDLEKSPTILKQGIIDKERTRWVQSLAVTPARSLKVGSNYQPGSSHDFEETLTIAYRKGQFYVVGFDTFWENPNDIGNCQINLTTGKGRVGVGEVGGTKRVFKLKTKAVPLPAWSKKTRPGECD